MNDNSTLGVVANPEDMAVKAQDLATEALFSEGDHPIGITPIAEQHYLLAIAALRQAEAHFKLASYWHSRKD